VPGRSRSNGIRRGNGEEKGEEEEEEVEEEETAQPYKRKESNILTKRSIAIT
jgi:hypothetical protein